MAKKYYAVHLGDDKVRIYCSLAACKKAIQAKGQKSMRGFDSYIDALVWSKHPKWAPAKANVYAVKKGRKPGIYRTEEVYREQMQGFSGASGRVFYTELAARAWLKGQDNLIDREGQIVSDEQEFVTRINSIFTNIFVFVYSVMSRLTAIYLKKLRRRRIVKHSIKDTQSAWVYCQINTSHPLFVYTDASVRKHKGVGYAAVIVDEAAGSKLFVGSTTELKNIGNSMRAELYAIVKALGIIDPTCKAKVIVYTDAYSLVQMVTSGELEKWKKSGWPIKRYANADLWKVYYELTKQRSISLQWVRGHNKNLNNIICDKIAGWMSKM